MTAHVSDSDSSILYLDETFTMTNERRMEGLVMVQQGIKWVRTFLWI